MQGGVTITRARETVKLGVTFQLSGDCINCVIEVLSVQRYFRSVAFSVMAVLCLCGTSAKMSMSMTICSDIEINDDDRK